MTEKAKKKIKKKNFIEPELHREVWFQNQSC